MAGNQVPRYAGAFLQDTSGNSRRQASLPCLDTNLSSLAPSGRLPLSLGAFYFLSRIPSIPR
jgi:hypothetical protein